MLYKKVKLYEDDEEIFLEVCVADKIGSDKRKAILVIPGGGYGCVCSDREGEPIGQAFVPYGFNYFVLHYSVARKRVFPAQLIEASLAIKHIKDNAEEYNIDPEKVFVTGFSAGGHLTAMCGTMWKTDAVQKAIDAPYGYTRPAGIMPIYPVICPDALKPEGKNGSDAVPGSFYNLLGTNTPTKEQLEGVDVVRFVDEDSSPAFIMHTVTDMLVDVKNSLVFAEAYRAAGLKFELHIYPDAPHGVALGNKITRCGTPQFENEAIAKWVENAVYWADHLD